MNTSRLESSPPDFDESLLEQNLLLTVEQRLVTHDSALEVALEFKKAGQILYANQNLLAAEDMSDHER